MLALFPSQIAYICLVPEKLSPIPCLNKPWIGKDSHLYPDTADSSSFLRWVSGLKHYVPNWMEHMSDPLSHPKEKPLITPDLFTTEEGGLARIMEPILSNIILKFHLILHFVLEFYVCYIFGTHSNLNFILLYL